MARIVLIAAALVVALLTGWAVQTYVDRRVAATEAEMAAAPPPTDEVLVAVRDLPLGHTVTADDFRWHPWPEDAVDDRYFNREDRPTALEDLLGATVRQPVVGGEPITTGKVIRRGEAGTLAALLEPGMRAVSLQVSLEAGVSGFILPGDRVDLILTQRLDGAGTDLGQPFSRITSETIAENVRVLAIDQSIAAPAEGVAAVAKALTVEVTPAQAEALFLARTLGTISLALRNAYGSTPETAAVRPTGGTRAEDVSAMLRGSAPAEVRVLAARHDLRPGTLLRDEHLTWIKAPDVLSYDTHFVESPGAMLQLRGSLVAAPISAGESLTEDKVIRPGESSFLTTALQPGMRAVSVALTPVSGVGGLLTPGDRVDVLLTTTFNIVGAAIPERQFGETVVENARILTLDQRLDPNTGRFSAPTSATLELMPKQAESLAVAAKLGELSLSLRPPGDNRLLTLTAAKHGLPTFTTDGDVSRVVSSILRGERLGNGSMSLELPLPEPEPIVDTSAKAEPVPSGPRIKLYRAATPVYVEPGK